MGGVRDGDVMAQLIFFFMIILMVYWISGLSGISPIGNATVSAKFNPVYSDIGKPFMLMFTGLLILSSVKMFTKRFGGRKEE